MIRTRKARGLAAVYAVAAALACAAPASAGPGAPPASDADTLRDIRGPVEIAPPWWHAWRWAVGAGAGAGVVALGAYAVRRHTRRPADPVTQARQRLARARTLLDARDVKGFADAVSDALRGYVEARFEVRAPRLTTEEFLGRVAAQERSPLVAHRLLLAEFLGRADRAKFGGYVLDVDEMLAMDASARSFIDTTARAPVRGES